MKKTVAEFVEETGLSEYTVRKIFAAAKIYGSANSHRPALMGEKPFYRLLKELNIDTGPARRKKNATTVALAFQLITLRIKKEYGTIKHFCEVTGFNLRRFNALAYGITIALEEDEERILRGILEI